MAKQTTYSKRDNEKKKNEKRAEKQKKKELRKLNEKPAGFDDMIAYVNEYGQLSSTPHMPKNEVEKSTENKTLQSHHRKNDKPENLSNRTGLVEHVNAEKGYGFITEKTLNAKHFFHVSGLLESVQVGDIVIFDLEQGKKGYNAVRIKKETTD